jgi:hypothetical protein
MRDEATAMTLGGVARRLVDFRCSNPPIAPTATPPPNTIHGTRTGQRCTIFPARSSDTKLIVSRVVLLLADQLVRSGLDPSLRGHGALPERMTVERHDDAGLRAIHDQRPDLLREQHLVGERRFVVALEWSRAVGECELELVRCFGRRSSAIKLRAMLKRVAGCCDTARDRRKRSSASA